MQGLHVTMFLHIVIQSLNELICLIAGDCQSFMAFVHAAAPKISEQCFHLMYHVNELALLSVGGYVLHVITLVSHERAFIFVIKEMHILCCRFWWLWVC